MYRISETECKEILLNGLKVFADLCDTNNLQYYLAYGTLLGAVRHEGFIPWDDDIDLWMPRKDYDILLEKYSQINTISDWTLNAHEIQPKYWHSSAKFSYIKSVILPLRFNNNYRYGLSIDIFPLDEVPESFPDGGGFSLSDDYQRGCRLLCIERDNKSLSQKILKYVIRCFLELLGIKYCKLYKNFVDNIRKINTGVPFYLCCFEERDIFKKEWFDKYKEVKFENDFYKVPYNYESVLKTRYGDFMKLPPEIDRVSKHQYDAYYL